jgi:hypothetical protein
MLTHAAKRTVKARPRVPRMVRSSGEECRIAANKTTSAGAVKKV